MLNKFLYLLAFIVVFNFSLRNPKDPDLGWRMKQGEYVIKHRLVLRNNTLSSELPNFEWANTNWLIDPITYIIFTKSGFFGLTLANAVLITLIFFVFSKTARLTLWEQSLVFPLILYFEDPYIHLSFRGQHTTILAIAIMFYLISRIEEGQKKLMLFFPPLFLLWANLHGGFVLGLLIFLIWLAVLFLKIVLKKEKIGEIRLPGIIFVISVAVTFINPFGMALYEGIFLHVSGDLFSAIGEWTPPFVFSSLWWNLVLLCLMVSFSLYLFFRKKHIFKNATLLLFLPILFFYSFNVRRYAWITFVASIPILGQAVSLLNLKKQTLKIFISSLILFGLYAYILFIKLPKENLFRMDWDLYCSYRECSRLSAEFLKDKVKGRKLFTFYDWGGYLIWNYPEIKPSIDGRMFLWKNKNGYSPFVEYYNYDLNIKDIDKSSYNMVYTHVTRPLFGRLLELVKLGEWQMAYKDSRAGVFVRKNKK